MRHDTAKYTIESGKSASSIAEEINIGKDTVCRWVRDYRKTHGLPSYAQTKGIKPLASGPERELSLKIKSLEKEVKLRDKQLLDEKEKIEILKNLCASSCKLPYEV